MAGRKVHDAAEARAMLEAAGQSGESRASWCRRAGVDARSLNAWRLNLGRVRSPQDQRPAARLVELVGEEPSAMQRSPIRITYGAFSVEVGADVDADTLHRVLWAVSQC